MSLIFILIVNLCLAVLGRAWVILPQPNSTPQATSQSKRKGPCRFAVFLGSGGHTSESLALVSSLNFARYTPRTYIISEGDTLSAKKAVALEMSRSSDPATYEILVVPRARRVHQSLWATPPTAVWSLLFCIYHASIVPFLSKNSRKGPFPVDVLLVNGPGTCFVLCAAVYLNKFLGLGSPKLIYVESFARVDSLSLSAKFLRRLVDRFIVQWPNAIADGGRGECHGWLV